DARDGVLRGVAVRAARQVLAHEYGDFGLGRGFAPSRERNPGSRLEAGAIGEMTDEWRGDPQRFHGGGRAEPDFPADGFLAGLHAFVPVHQLRLHAARDAEIVPGSAHCFSGCYWANARAYRAAAPKSTTMSGLRRRILPMGRGFPGLPVRVPSSAPSAGRRWHRT